MSELALGEETLAAAPHGLVADLARRALRVLAVALAACVVVGLLWQGAISLFGITQFVLPTPGQVLSQAQWSQVWSATASTVGHVLIGFTAGNLAGIALALATVASRFVAALLYPFALSFRSIPIVAVAPFITLAVGRGIESITVIATLLVFFPTYVIVLLGLRSVDPQMLELARVLNCSQAQVFLRVRFPTALPALMSSFRIAAPTAVLGVLIGEWVIGINGLGQLILNDSINLDLPTMWAGVIVAAALSLVAFGLVSVAERLVLGWRTAQ